MDYRKCDQDGCDQEAIYACVWMKQQYYCTEHTQRVIAAMPMARNTLRFMSGYEAFVETDEDSQPCEP